MDEIVEAVESCIDELPSFRSDIEDKDIILYVGLTRSGKSTVVNCVIGNDLEAIQVRDIYKIKKVVDNSHGPEIGQGSVSSTSMPSLYPRNNALIMDSPGFIDNRGMAQEIINALFLKQIQHAKTCKFVLVCDINEIIHDNIQLFTNSLTSLVELVGSVISNSLSLVFTKVKLGYSRDDIVNDLNEKIIEQPNLSVSTEARLLLQIIIEHPERISLFRMPSQECIVINDELLVGHDEAVDSSEALDMCDITIRFCTSVETQNTLYRLFVEFSQDINFAELNDFYESFKNYFIVDKYVYASTKDELIETNKQIIICNKKLCLEKRKTFGTIRDVLNSICIFTCLDDSDRFFRKMSLFAEFEEISTIDLKVNQNLTKKYLAWITNLETDIDKLISKIYTEQKHRLRIDFDFNLEAGIGGAGVGLSVIGGIGLRIAALETLPAIIPAAAAAALPAIAMATTGIGVVVGGIMLGMGVKTLVFRKQERKRRLAERILQGRFVPS